MSLTFPARFAIKFFDTAEPIYANCQTELALRRVIYRWLGRDRLVSFRDFKKNEFHETVTVFADKKAVAYVDSVGTYKQRGYIVHKALNLQEVQDSFMKVPIKSGCGVHHRTPSFWYSHWWKDVNCANCLKFKARINE